MTGAYVRVQRDGRFGPVEFDQLTDAELEEFRIRSIAAGDGTEEGCKWAIFLARWIRDTGGDPP